MGGERKGLNLAREVLKALGQAGKQQNHKQPTSPENQLAESDLSLNTKLPLALCLHLVVETGAVPSER